MSKVFKLFYVFIVASVFSSVVSAAEYKEEAKKELFTAVDDAPTIREKINIALGQDYDSLPVVDFKDIGAYERYHYFMNTMTAPIMRTTKGTLVYVVKKSVEIDHPDSFAMIEQEISEKCTEDEQLFCSEGTREEHKNIPWYLTSRGLHDADLISAVTPEKWLFIKTIAVLVRGWGLEEALYTVIEKEGFLPEFQEEVKESVKGIKIATQEDFPKIKECKDFLEIPIQDIKETFKAIDKADSKKNMLIAALKNIPIIEHSHQKKLAYRYTESGGFRNIFEVDRIEDLQDWMFTQPITVGITQRTKEMFFAIRLKDKKLNISVIQVFFASKEDGKLYRFSLPERFNRLLFGSNLIPQCNGKSCRVSMGNKDNGKFQARRYWEDFSHIVTKKDIKQLARIVRGLPLDDELLNHGTTRHCQSIKSRWDSTNICDNYKISEDPEVLPIELDRCIKEEV